MLELALAPYMQHLSRRYMHFSPAVAGLAPTPQPNKDYLLYIHIPFCEALCPFCSFHRVLLKQPRADRYFAALRREIRNYRDKGFNFVDVYVGGGTPTVIPEQLIETLALVRSMFPIQRISVETNPDHLVPATLRALKGAGVDRLSVGVQSFDDQLLAEMGRLQRYGSGEQIIERLQESHGIFNTLNVDMMFNLPHQTEASLQRDINLLTEQTMVDQVSFYPLMGAASTAKAMSKTMGEVSFHRERAYYNKILAGMRPQYQPSTAWCFARKGGLVDEYIVDHDNYIGVGSGAFSYVDGNFYSSSFSVDRYIEHITRGRSAMVMGRKLSEVEQLRYEFLMKLFGLELDWDALRRQHASRLLPLLWKERLFFVAIGALRRDGGRYKLTTLGMYYWVVMMREFLTGVNNFRDEMRGHIRVERMLGRHPAESPEQGRDQVFAGGR